MAVLERITLRDDINDPNFAADNQLVFRATFTGDVANVTADDFNVTGTSGATISSAVSVNNSDAQYDIVVTGANLSTFNGEVGIELAPGQNIVDPNDNNSPVPNNPPTGRNDSYTLGSGGGGGDITAPSITSIERQAPADATTGEDALVFRVTFDEAVQNVNVFDFIVNGGTTATVSGFIEISNNVYDLTVSGGDLANFNGPVGIDLAAAQNITDIAGNALPAGEPAIDEVYTLANASVPELVSIERLTPAAETTNSDTLVFQVTFSEDVQNIDAADFVVNGGTTALVTAIAAVNNNSVYNVTVSGGDLADFNGPVNLALAANQDITNLTNVAVPVAAPTGANEAYTVTNNPADPTLISIERLTPGTETTSEDTLVFQATFDEGVQNVDAADFSINGNTTATITDVTAVSDSVYNITVAGGDLANFNGTVGLDLAATQDITDLIGNDLPAGEPATDESYTVANTPTPDSSLNPLGNVLEISQFVSFQSLSLETLVSNITSVGDVNIYQTDAAGSSRTLIAEFSVLEADVLGAGYTPRYTLIGDDFDIDFDDASDNSNFIQIEVVEKGVTSIGKFTATSETEVTLEFEGNTQLNVSLTDDTLDDDLLNNDASTIDLTGLTGTSEVTFTVYREAKLTNTVGFYTTDTADGGIIIDQVTGATLMPGDAGYKEAALANQLRGIQLTGVDGQETTFDATITNGVFLSTFVVIDGVDPAVGEVFFGHQGVNSDGIDHMKKVGANTFGIEDIAGGGDRDFNDLVVEFDITAIAA